MSAGDSPWRESNRGTLPAIRARPEGLSVRFVSGRKSRAKRDSSIPNLSLRTELPFRRGRARPDKLGGERTYLASLGLQLELDGHAGFGRDAIRSIPKPAAAPMGAGLVTL